MIKTREDIVSDVFTSLWDKLDTDSFDLQSETALGYIKDVCKKQLPELSETSGV